MRFFIMAMLMLGMASISQAQTEVYLNKLQEKTSWTFEMDGQLYGLKGTFAGVNGQYMQIRDEEGFKHPIPIDALTERDRLLFWEFRGDVPMINAPGAHARRMQNEQFADYQDRLTEKRIYALKTRAEINSQKPPARGWLAIHVPFNPSMPLGNFFEMNQVQQPPIPYWA